MKLHHDLPPIICTILAINSYILEEAMRTYSTLAAIFLFFGASPVAAQSTADMTKVTCEELTTGNAADMVVISVWMSGYFNAKQNNSVIDIKQLSENAKNVGAYCRDNPKVTVMTAIETIAKPK
jgi:hypothetical protein